MADEGAPRAGVSAEARLTFNTTSLLLKRALRDGKLLERAPLRPLGSDQKRYLLVTPEIDALLDGHVLFGVFPDVSAEKLIGKFVAGHLMTVSRKVTRAKPDIEQIVGANEVWALCPRLPRPGWRILGRWHKQGIFVALRPWEKGRLFRNYSQAAQEVIDDWQHLLGAEPVHTGASPEDYVGGVFRDVDEDP
jgi:hypothetical protein